MKPIRYITSILVILCGILLPETTISRDFMAKFLSVNEGLTRNCINAMLRDSRGFLWVGTPYGLNRYDNHKLKQYYASEDGESIYDNEVIALFEDREGRIWVFGNKEISRYNPRTEQFSRLTFNGQPVKARSVYSLEDGILLGGEGGLYKYAYETDSISTIPTEGGSAKSYTTILEWTGGRMLLQTKWDGLWVYTPETGKIVPSEMVKEKGLNSITKDHHGNLWVSIYGKGVMEFGPDEKLVTHYTTSHGLPTHLITDLLTTPEGVLVASEKGLDIINPGTGEIRPYPVAGYEGKLGGIRRLYSDDAGNLYLGTIRNGIMMMQEVTMRTFQLNASSKLENTVSSITRGKKDEILCGIDGYGIVAFNPTTNQLRLLPSTHGMKVIGLAEWGNEKTLVSEYVRNLYILDNNTERLSPVPAFIQPIIEGNHNLIGMTLTDVNDNLIAACSDSVYFIYPKEARIEPITYDGPESKFLGKYIPFYSNDEIIYLYKNKDVYRIGLEDRDMKLVVTSPYGDELVGAQYDGDHTLYLATHNNVFGCDLATGKTEPFRLGPIRNISTLKLDGDKVWIGTTDRLFMIAGEKIFSFDDGDGVVPNEFLPASIYADSTFIYFGGTNGLARINRSETDSLAHNRSITARIGLAEFYVNGVSQMSKIKDGYVSIPASDASILIRVITKDSKPFRSKMYRFYLEGAGATQPLETLQPSITVNDLPSGHKVKVLVSYSLSDGNWSEPQELVVLDVKQVWWKSWWFILTVVILLVIALWLSLRYIRHKWENAAIQQRQHMLERDVEILANINEGLRSPVEKIAKPLQDTIDSLSKGEAIDTTKLHRQLVNALGTVDHMKDIVNSPFEMLHPQNMSITSMMLTARFNLWLMEQLNSYSRAQRLNRKLHFDFIPEYDPGAITFNASRMEVIVTCLVNEIVADDQNNIEVTVAKDPQSPGCINVSFANRKAYGQLHNSGEDIDGGENLKIVYARWLAELDESVIEPYNDDKGQLAKAVLRFKVVKNNDSVPRLQTYQIKDEDEGVHELTKDISDLSNRTLLIAVSDVATANYIRNGLTGTFKTILTATTMEEAVKSVNRDYPDIVIGDSSSSILDGMTLCQTIKSDDKTDYILVVMLTSDNVNKIKEKAFRHGADAYLEKPFDIQVLLSICRSLAPEMVPEEEEEDEL